MTHSQEPEPESDQQSTRSNRWLGTGLAVGSILLLVGVGAAWRGWVLARSQLSPWLSAQLSEALNRPVELGPLEHLSLSRVRLGPSTLPATATDPDTLSLEAVEVQLNPLSLLRRELPLTVVLEQVAVYLEQDANREWVTLDIQPIDEEPTREPFIAVKLDTLRLEDSRLTLVPYGEASSNPASSNPASSNLASSGPPVVTLVDVQGKGEFSDVVLDTRAASGEPLETQQIDLAITGTSIKGGSRGFNGFCAAAPPGSQSGFNRGDHFYSLAGELGRAEAEAIPRLSPGLGQARP
ncbi:MAG: hypothetical protein HC922_01885 [Leptolyngbyaceae cyanobacterium SM2_3_12]|nr:hypothetical protein [Leptolyngbyaceae cyanobacterium SM2_3_12]